jgi:hypothetical protein
VETTKFVIWMFITASTIPIGFILADKIKSAIDLRNEWLDVVENYISCRFECYLAQMFCENNNRLMKPNFGDLINSSETLTTNLLVDIDKLIIKFPSILELVLFHWKKRTLLDFLSDSTIQSVTLLGTIEANVQLIYKSQGIS